MPPLPTAYIYLLVSHSGAEFSIALVRPVPGLALTPTKALDASRSSRIPFDNYDVAASLERLVHASLKQHQVPQHHDGAEWFDIRHLDAAMALLLIDEKIAGRHPAEALG